MGSSGKKRGGEGLPTRVAEPSENREDLGLGTDRFGKKYVGRDHFFLAPGRDRPLEGVEGCEGKDGSGALTDVLQDAASSAGTGSHS